MHDRFVTAVEQFATRRAIPVVRFEPGQDKDAITAAHRPKVTAREPVVPLRIAQEKVRSFKAPKQTVPGVYVPKYPIIRSTAREQPIVGM